MSLFSFRHTRCLNPLSPFLGQSCSDFSPVKSKGKFLHPSRTIAEYLQTLKDNYSQAVSWTRAARFYNPAPMICWSFKTLTWLKVARPDILILGNAKFVSLSRLPWALFRHFFEFGALFYISSTVEHLIDFWAEFEHFFAFGETFQHIFQNFPFVKCNILSLKRFQ